MSDRQATTRIDSIEFSTGGDDRLRSARLDLPRAASVHRSYSFPIGGSIVGNPPVMAVELSANGAPMGRLPVKFESPVEATAHPELEWAAHSDFRGRVGVATVPRRFDLEMAAVMGDHERLRIGRVTGERQALPSRSGSAIQPIIVTTLGRSGSTLLSWLLGRHPNVLAFGPYFYDPRAAGYHAELFRAWADPASYLMSVRGRSWQPEWWLGRGTSLPPEDPELDSDAWLGSAFVEDALDHTAARVESFYRAAPYLEERPAATHFVEKYHPGYFLQEHLWEIYPGMREIFLVRDLRDVVCSIVAFSSAYNLAWSREAGATSDEQFVRERMRPLATTLAREWRRRADKAFLLRYEELISAPTKTLSQLLSYIGVDCSAATVERMLTEAELSDAAKVSEHRTTPTPAASIGRWRRDLTPALQRVCSEELGEPLGELGYEPGP